MKLHNEVMKFMLKLMKLIKLSNKMLTTQTLLTSPN